MFNSWEGWIYEATHPDPIIKLIECCYMARHEKNLILEEETYRMLVELMRSPELFKSITGSHLKGFTDPHYDKLTPDEKAKIDHLDRLEQKGYDVEKLK
jgi:hypothetical protein